MHKILFICHGNICRSTMAQSIMQHLVDRAGLASDFLIDSAATTSEELGMPPHRGTVSKLKEVGVPVVPHRARKVERAEYDRWNLIVYMDAENARHLDRIFGGDPEGKLVRLMAFAPGAGIVDADAATRTSHDSQSDGMPSTRNVAALAQASKAAPDVADPWYTGNFDATYRDVLAGCTGLLAWCRAALGNS